MKLFLIAMLLAFTTSLFADEVKVEINPPKPVAGEVFQAYFRIFTESSEEPTINFSPGNVEVVGKANQGVSLKTIYDNGRLTSTREITIAYDLVSSKAGFAALRDIQVQVGKKVLRHPTVNLTILKEAEQLADVFVMADVPNKRLFLGDGVVARYYLYSKVPVSNLDIKKYPKLNNFLKRFLQEPERTERVSVDGQLYMRTQIYAARLYPEKTGKLKIDSLSLSATYPSSNDPFGAFGMGRDFKTRTITSENIEVEVLPLPQPVPPHFTGLVGNHDFDLQVGQSKLIVNEPLEIKLTVTGSGALENLEAPELIKNPALEEFETNGDLKISAADRATKTFDYTFLAKENLNLPAKTVTLSYFDPNSQKYVPVQLQIPEIVIAGGGAAQARRDENRPKEDEKKSETKIPQVQKLTELAGPVSVEEWQWKNWLPLINVSLAIMAILLSVGWAVKFKGLSPLRVKHEIPSAFKKGNFEFTEFVQWMTPLIKETGKSPVVIIKESPLPEESKRYFIDLLAANDYKEYSSRKSQMDFKYEASHFKKLGQYIASAGHESTSQPT